MGCVERAGAAALRSPGSRSPITLRPRLLVRVRAGSPQGRSTHSRRHAHSVRTSPDARRVGSSDDRYEKGLDAYASQFGIDRDQVPAWFAERFGERFGTEAINSAGGAWPEDALSLRDRSLIVIAALATQGGVDSRLPGHVRWAIRARVEPRGARSARDVARGVRWIPEGVRRDGDRARRARPDRGGAARLGRAVGLGAGRLACLSARGAVRAPHWAAADRLPCGARPARGSRAGASPRRPWRRNSAAVSSRSVIWIATSRSRESYSPLAVGDSSRVRATFPWRRRKQSPERDTGS